MTLAQNVAAKVGARKGKGLGMRCEMLPCPSIPLSLKSEEILGPAKGLSWFIIQSGNGDVSAFKGREYKIRRQRK
jgi:hypothetical protein